MSILWDALVVGWSGWSPLGGLLGLSAGSGGVMVVGRIRQLRRPWLNERLAPFVVDTAHQTEIQMPPLVLSRTGGTPLGSDPWRS